MTDTVGLLDVLPGIEARRALGRAHRRRFRDREVLFHQGDPADCLHVVVSGRVAVRVSEGLGTSVTLDVVGAGELVGELALLEPGARRTATVVALERTETLALAASHFAELRAAHPDIDAVLLSTLARRNRALITRLAEAVHVRAETRVLRRLLAAAGAYDGRVGDPVVVPMSQDDLAGLAATTRETVNRVLRREVERGTLTLSRRRVTIVDAEAIRRLSR